MRYAKRLAMTSRFIFEINAVTAKRPPSLAQSPHSSSMKPTPKGVVQQVGDSCYSLEIRGAKMVLERISRGWRVKTINASSRAWSMGGESWKEFPDLEGVEKHYKSWRGIAALVEATGPQKH